MVERRVPDVDKIVAVAMDFKQQMDYDMAALYYNRAGETLEERLDWARAAKSFEWEADCLSRGLESGDLPKTVCVKAKEACLKAESLYRKAEMDENSNRVRRLKEYVDRMIE